jgi:hypothetical protein
LFKCNSGAYMPRPIIEVTTTHNTILQPQPWQVALYPLSYTRIRWQAWLPYRGHAAYAPLLAPIALGARRPLLQLMRGEP